MSSAVDFLSPALSNGPSEWPEIDPELVESLRPDPVYGFLTRRQLRLRQDIAASRWFLLSNWMRFRSRETGRIEENFTLGGVERPFNGLNAIHAFIQQAIGADATLSDVVDAVLGDLIALGAVKPITPERAAQLRFDIFLKTGYDVAAPAGQRKVVR